MVEDKDNKKYYNNTITMKKLINIFLIALALGFTACNNDDDDPIMSNQDFVTRASSSNLFEIRAGEIAVARGENPDVKAFGQHMIDEHTLAGAELEDLAEENGWSVQTEPFPADEQELDNLEDLTGEEFDERFLRVMVISHENTYNLFDLASGERGVPNEALRNWARGKLPTLEMHFDEALELYQELNPNQ